jgi:hypothetical protein
MKAWTAIGTALILMTGCVTDEEAASQQAVSDDAKCQSYGAKPGTDPYIQCRVALGQQQMQADQARKQRALQYLMNQQAQPQPLNTYQLPPTVNCTSTTLGQTTNTSCR